MIDNLYDLNQTIHAVAQRILEYAATHSHSGNYTVGYDTVSDLIDYEDYLEHAGEIEGELLGREEVLDIEFSDEEFSLNIGLHWCPNYQWCEGDEEIFGMSQDEWEHTFQAKPISKPLDPNRLAEIGEKAIAYVLESSDTAIEDLTERLGMSMAELEQLGIYKYAELNQHDLYTGKWRVQYVPPGGHYGTHNQLINEDTRALVHFYDMSQNKDKFPNGQSTGVQYYASTLLENTDFPAGLYLDASIPAWTVSREEMKDVLSYLKTMEEHHNPRKPFIEKLYDAESRSGRTLPPDAPEKGR